MMARACSFGREKIRRPFDAAARAFRRDLEHGVVVLGLTALRAPRQALPLVVDRDDWLARAQAFAGADDARFSFELGVNDEAENEPGVQRADVTRGVPNFLGIDLDEYRIVKGGHEATYSQSDCRRWLDRRTTSRKASAASD